MGDHDDFLSGLGDHDGDGDGDEDEENGGENFDWAKSKKSLALFLIDCSAPMFAKCEIKRNEYSTVHLSRADGDDNDDESAGVIKYESRFSFALSEISKFCRNQVQKGTADRFGVVLFNVEGQDSKDQLKNNGVNVLVELNQPNVHFIKSLEQHAKPKPAGVPKPSAKLYDPQGRSHLQNGLDECKKILYQQKEEVKDAKKAIYVVTWLDDPIGSDKGFETRRRMCLDTVKDCRDNGILVSIVPLAAAPADTVLPDPPPDSKASAAAAAAASPTVFYVGGFYEELARRAQPPPPAAGAATATAAGGLAGDADVDVVREVVERRIWHLEQEVMGVLNPRSIASLQWCISEDPQLQVAVKLYPLTMEAKIKSSVWLDQRNNKRVRVMTQRACRTTGQLLMESQIEKYFPYGKATAVIDDKEMAKVKSLDIKPGLHLLGFRSRDSLRLEDNLRAPYFMYPDERGGRGSTLAFTALWESMLRHGRAAVCTLRARANVAPRLAALVPARERRDDGGRVLSPDGMHVVALPFCDDIRALPPHPAAAGPPAPEAVAAARRIIDFYQLDTSGGACRDFQNPQLYRHFRHLEALSLDQAVDERDLDEVEDAIMPNPDHYAGPEVAALFRDFKDAVGGADFDAAMAAAEAGGGAAGAKRKREPKPAAAPPDAGLKALVEGGGLAKCTVPQLKEHLKALGLPVSGNKADLVERIKARCAQPD